LEWNVSSFDLQHSDYIVYVDESGDHSLESINPRYPLFVLSFCIFEKTHYAHFVTPRLRMLKFSAFGHDMVVLHEQDIRKRLGAFSKLSKEPRDAFLNELSTLMAQCTFTVIPILIDKYAMKAHGVDPIHVYHLAMRLGLETLHQLLMSYGQHDFLTHIVFEARGQKEDVELELEFRRVCDYNNFLKKRLPFEIVISDKRSNSEGLQFADIIARPIGLSVLRPEQPNRAFAILKEKIYQEQESFVYPLKAKDPKVVLEAQTPVG
jgi:hypothetical protein